MDKITQILKDKKFYEIAVIAVTLGSFFVWLIYIFKEGYDSSQFELFFQKCADFFADTLNVVGYSSERDVYNNTMYSGLSEKAYPPLTYLFMYFFSRLVSMDTYYDMNYFLYMFHEPKFLIILLICGLVIMFGVYEIIRTCKTGSGVIKSLTAFAMIFSAPMIYSIERANTIIITVFCVFFFLFFLRQHQSDSQGTGIDFPCRCDCVEDYAGRIWSSFALQQAV